MSNLVGMSQRDMDTRPYSADEQRVAAWLVAKIGIGGGDDPIGFLIASHDCAIVQRNILRDGLSEIADTDPDDGTAWFHAYAREVLEEAWL